MSASNNNRAGGGQVRDTTTRYSLIDQASSPAARSNEKMDRHVTTTTTTRRFPTQLEGTFQNLSVLVKKSREPLGILKMLEFIFSILALAAAVDSPHMISIFCPENKGTYIKYSYPYKMNKVTIKACDPSCFLVGMDRCSSSAQFFAFVAVMSFIVAPAIVLMYLTVSRRFKRLQLLRIAEVAITAIFAISWFAGSCAWAAAVSEIRHNTNPKYISGILTRVSDLGKCDIYPASHGWLIFSVFLGFCNVVFWSLNIVFLLKGMDVWKSHRNESEMMGIKVDSKSTAAPATGSSTVISLPTAPPAGSTEHIASDRN